MARRAERRAGKSPRLPDVEKLLLEADSEISKTLDALKDPITLDPGLKDPITLDRALKDPDFLKGPLLDLPDLRLVDLDISGVPSEDPEERPRGRSGGRRGRGEAR